jgi:hypothetical protein
MYGLNDDDHVTVERTVDIKPNEPSEPKNYGFAVSSIVGLFYLLAASGLIYCICWVTKQTISLFP